jgi:lycopene cyclase CruA
MNPQAAHRDADFLRAIAGPELVERLSFLDASIPTGAAGFSSLPVPPAAPVRGDLCDFDVVIAGGGLSLLLAPVLAARGLRVAVFDRGHIGAVHREWNCSAEELAPLWETGLLARETVASLVLNRYRHGFCRWHGGGTYPVTGALDHAVDAGALLEAVRARAISTGVKLHDRHPVTADAAGPDAVRVAFTTPEGASSAVTARVFVDARGSASPRARADLTCPTVGGVFTGLAEGVDDPRRIDPGVGEILVTTEGIVDGRQHIWEAFPGRPGETTLYLFAYEPMAARRPGDLMRLYARFFERLPEYKLGEARMVRPTFGHIPGWSRQVPGPVSEHPRIVLFGDAAARHSPLTFCGFGKMLRSFGPVADALVQAIADGSSPGDPTPEEPIHRLTGALALVMARPSTDPARAESLNTLLDAAFRRLHGLGDAAYRDLIRDRLDVRRFVKFAWATSRERPEVYDEVFRVLGPLGAARWGLGAATRALFTPHGAAAG